jgi:hypothetical protein
MSKRHAIHTVIILGAAYLMGSPALAAMRPAIVDHPLRSFHEEVGRAAETTRVTLTSLQGSFQAYLTRLTTR